MKSWKGGRVGWIRIGQVQELIKHINFVLHLCFKTLLSSRLQNGIGTCIEQSLSENILNLLDIIMSFS